MVEKLNMKSSSTIEEKVKIIRNSFPNCVTETLNDGKKEFKIDFDLLKQELSEELIEDKQERYQMTWPGKKESILIANKRTDMTLRPVFEKSKNFDSTKNIYIEGDNLETLKLLRETYLNKIKMIYIDPPYNTGSDFLYEDDFSIGAFEFAESDLQKLDGNRMVQNVDSNGRFHTEWLNNIYPRLKIARDLLTDDGVMFISIDDHEVDNLLKVCRELFSNSLVDVMVWRKSGAGRDGKMKNTATFRKDHEYIVVCFKNIAELNKSFEKPNFINTYPNSDNDPRGPYKAGSISRTEEASNPLHKNYYTVYSPNGTAFTRQFDISKEEFLALDNDKLQNSDGKMVGRIYWGKNDDACPAIKIFVNEKRSVTTSSYIIEPSEIINSNTIDDGNATTTKGSKELESILGIEGIGGEMRPKPSFLLKALVQIGSHKDSIVLDFYSGTGTLASAVMQQNIEDGGNRKYICVQIPQECAVDTIAYKNGYKTICDLAEDRINKEIELFKENKNLFNKDFDDGLRVFRLDSSNMQNVFYNPKEITQSILDLTIDNIKTDRSAFDLLLQIMLELGIELSSKIEEKEIDGKKYYRVNDNDLIACFDNELTNEIIVEIAKQQPLYAVFKNKSFTTDSVGINNEQIFKTYSSSTVIKII